MLFLDAIFLCDVDLRPVYSLETGVTISKSLNCSMNGNLPIRVVVSCTCTTPLAPALGTLNKDLSQDFVQKIFHPTRGFEMFHLKIVNTCFLCGQSCNCHDLSLLHFQL